MRLIVSLRNTRSGKTGSFGIEMPVNWDEDSIMDYFFEGNMECDCNRSLMLYPEEPDKELSCNPGDNLIVIDEIRDNVGGRVLYKGGDVQAWKI